MSSNSLTYTETILQAQKISAYLQKLGVQRGDRIMIIAQNRAEVILAAFAAAYLGAIFTILNNTIKAYSLRQILDQVKPTVVLLDETSLDLAAEFNNCDVILVGNVNISSLSRPIINFNEILQTSPTEIQKFPGIDLDPACLIFTSGSTGVPRGVIVTHDNILFSTAVIQERLAYKSDDVVGLFLPLSFDYGLYQIFLTMAAGATIFIGHSGFAGPELISKLMVHEISILPGVPSLFATMIKLLNRRFTPLPYLRCVTNTGQHLPQSHIEQLRRFYPQINVFAMYGLTECKRVSILKPEELEQKPGSVGRPLAGTEVYVVDENGSPLSPGKIGELVVRGRHVTSGYWQAPKETQLRFRQAAPGAPCALYTGDLCWIDKDNFIYFVERNDNQLKHRGFRINALEIETFATNIEGVLEAGLTQTKESDQLYLFLSVTKPEITAKDIIDKLQKCLEPYKIPHQVRFLSKLPKTPNGKLDRKQLKNFLDNLCEEDPYISHD